MYNRTKTTGSKARELWTDVTSCTLDWSRLLEFYLLNFQRCMWTRPLKASLAPSRVVSSDQWPSHWPGPTWQRPLDRRCRRTCRSFKVARKNQRRRLHVALLATDLWQFRFFLRFRLTALNQLFYNHYLVVCIRLLLLLVVYTMCSRRNSTIWNSFIMSVNLWSESIRPISVLFYAF